ncbi:glycosyltransferase family 2 protein [Alicyclobacillus sp. SO9]|uniref:tetratricopeptide repeat-containing glycosyltransferase family 2 protein n=1 Tax=Alicyclobacillus sp. SO9 TaxID=2665646 RepID=UPI0018E74573|nr:glycosyltransferase family 2 protein [Alicyclobacillus sp. SO9]QQE78110.1 glycosyltransferase family 2 protein [Alicyclobacillus sp. SO9]
MASIGLAMIVRNEAQVIEDCLRSAAGVDQMAVVDTGSTDETRTIVRRMGVTVTELEWRDDFSLARNQSLELLSTDYILVLDADERIEEGFLSKLKTFIDKHADNLGVVTIRSPWQTPSGELQTVRSQNTRFFPRSPEIRYQGRIHEQVVDAAKTRLRYHTGVRIWHEGYRQQRDWLEKKTKRNIDILLAELRDYPNNGYYLYQLGKSYGQLGHLNYARKYYEASIQVSTACQGYHPDLLLAALYNYKSLGLEQETWSLLEQTVQQYPKIVDFYFFLGRALIEFRIPNFDLIQSAFETCLELGKDPDSTVIVEGVSSYLALYNLGVFYESLSDESHAKHCYLQAANMGYEPAVISYNRMNSLTTPTS